jgi:hypothetical protein
MNVEKHKGRAKEMEAQVQVLLEDFNKVLAARGFGDLKVVSFAVGPAADKARLLTFAGSPCPTKCRVLPDGQIECAPDCS